MESNESCHSIELREFFNNIPDGKDIGLREKKMIMKISTIVHLAINDELIGNHTTREEIYQLLLKSNLDYRNFARYWVEKSNYFLPEDVEEISIKEVKGINVLDYSL